MRINAMPRLPDPPDEKTTFERMPNEPSLAWNAFTIYRDLGPGRTLDTVRQKLGKDNIYLPTLQMWSARWHWGQRCIKWDALIDLKTREAAFARMPLWEQRRQEALERNLDVLARLENRLLEMCSHPLTRRWESEDGREVTIEPAKWNWNSVVSGFKLVMEARAATIAEGLLEADDDDFDPETATPEELKAFISKHRRRKPGSSLTGA
jgi:hypothetical protein